MVYAIAIVLLNALSNERPRDCRGADRGYELPPFHADCHLNRPQRDRARCNVGQNITDQLAGR
jgi:hypothetical protein